MSERTGFFFDERCFWHTTGEHALCLPVGGWVQPVESGGHAESPASKRRFKSLLDVSGLAERLALRSGPPATEEDLRRIHTDDYLEAFRAASAARGGELGFIAPFGKGSYEIAALSAGLASAAIDAVLSGALHNAYALSRPPGHHALREAPMGFCLLANVAIAVETAKAKHGVDRVAILDWDVHHGNGTQAIFYDRPDVLTVSIHQENCFPQIGGGVRERGDGAGEGFNLNLPLAPGCGEETYLTVLDRLALPAIRDFRPELLVVACGFDANAVDPLARMLLSSLSFAAMTRRVKALAEELCGGRLVMVHEGGYSEAYVPFCGLATMEALSGFSTGVEDPLLPIAVGQQPLADVTAFQIERLARHFA